MAKVEIATERGVKGGDDIGPEVVMHWYSPEVKCGGVVVIDTTIHGMGGGGTRMLPDITTEEMFWLARAMTYKMYVLGRPLGGAKAGIWANPSVQGSQREAIMRAYGKAIRPLIQARMLAVGADMGTSHADLVWVREECGQAAPKVSLTLQEKDGELLEYHYTGYGVVVAARVACEFRGMNISRTTAAIEGFGKVGSGAARYLAQAGARVVAVSTICGAIYNDRGLDVNKLLELRRNFGDDLVLKYDNAKLIDKKDLFFLPVDILIPGGRPWVINEHNVDKVKAKVISNGANIPITYGAEEKLFQRGITVVPDFISNTGGTISSEAGRQGLNADQAFEAVEKLMSQNTREILEAASQEKINPGKLSRQRGVEWVQKARAGQAPSFEEYAKQFKKLIGVS